MRAMAASGQLLPWHRCARRRHWLSSMSAIVTKDIAVVGPPPCHACRPHNRTQALLDNPRAFRAPPQSSEERRGNPDYFGDQELRREDIYDGGSRSNAARLGNVTLQIIRDWVIRFNERGPQGLVNGKAPGQQSRLNDQQRAALALAVERGPTPYLDGVVRWRLCDLAQWLREEFRVSVSEQTLSREVRAMGYRKLAARPKHHAQDPQAIEDFKKVFRPQWQKLPPERPKESA